MKQIFLLLFMVNVTIISAQDLRLFQNTWYLTKIVSNGIDYLPPTNTEVSSIGLTFIQQNNTISTGVCNSMFGNVIFGNNQTDFFLTELGITLMMCNL
ncbi:META domain-containing protein [Flavobacterium sp.]|uniref:META domain-containing protein n=1 Tax=Flavobacterium sp. TaxID=239 RepID=UPI0038FCD2BD